MMFKAYVNLGSAGSAGLRERIEEEGPAGVGFTWDKLLTVLLSCVYMVMSDDVASVKGRRSQGSQKVVISVWLILRCWGNSSILCQQNSDAL